MAKASAVLQMIALMPKAIAELQADGNVQAASFIQANKLLLEEYFSVSGLKGKFRRLTGI